MTDHTHTTTTRPAPRRTRWAVPATALVIGIGYLVAGLVGGDAAFGVFGLVLMVAVGGAFVLAGRRSETVAGLIDRRDERINAIDRDATLFAGVVLIAAVIVLFMVELARGEDGMPYAGLGALGGLAYVAALVVLRVRR
jgi:hypothetical protein